MSASTELRRDEALQEALVELSLLREREAAALREATLLLAGLEAIGEAETPVTALEGLLAAIRDGLDCEAVALVDYADGGATVRAATEEGLVGELIVCHLPLCARPLRVADTRLLGGYERWPAGYRARRSLLSAPIRLEGGGRGAIHCLAAEAGRFGPDDQRLLARLAILAAQALSTLALAERNALLAAVIDGSANSVAIADADAEDVPLVYVNEAFSRLSGYEPGEALGRNCRFLSAADPADPERARLRESVAGRRAGSFELENRRRDGTRYWTRLSLFPVRDARRGRTHLVATQTDITVERAAAAERDAARRRLVAALSATSEGFLLVDARGRIVLANERWRDFFGAGGAGFEAGEDFADAWTRRLEAFGESAASARRLGRARRDALFAGGERREERLPDGRILLVGDRLTDDGGAVSIATDVTDLKTTERRLAERAAAIDAAGDGVGVTDLDGRFVYMNPSHLRMFGYETLEEVVGLHWSTLYPPDQRAVIERVAMPELQRVGCWRGEVTGRTRRGARVEQEVSLTLLPEIGLVCVTRDVSERHRGERERARLRDALHAAQRQESLGQLAAGVAHDFNNLLSVVTTRAAMLEARVEDDPQASEHVGRISMAAANAGGLVARLLDLAGRRREVREIDLRAAVTDAVALLRSSVPARVHVDVRLPGDAVACIADPTDIMQVVLNLGINARDALGPDAGEVCVALDVLDAAPEDPDLRVGTLPAGPVARLAITDTGPGIEPEVAASVFKPYFTTKGVDGTGLGLAVVSSVTTKAGGAVALAARPGRGAVFTVYWPLDARATPAPSALAARRSAASERAAALVAGCPVLVCDDQVEVARAIADALEVLGAEATVCEDPADALEAVSEDPDAWRLLVTDYDMPGMTGTALARAARAVAPGLAIVLCSALLEGCRYGGDAFLPKPVTPDALYATVVAAVEARAAARG